MKSLGWIIPVVLGVIAGVLYLSAVRSGTKSIDLVAVKSETVRAGNRLAEADLMRVSIRADRALVRSVVRWEDRGLIIERPVTRTLIEGELILFADVRQSSGNPRANLASDEGSLTVTVPQNRIVPGLRIGDDVMVVVTREGDDETPDKSGRVPLAERRIGPFKVVGVPERPEGAIARDDPRQVVLAVKVTQNGLYADPKGRELSDAINNARGNRVLGIEVPGAGGK